MASDKWSTPKKEGDGVLPVTFTSDGPEFSLSHLPEGVTLPPWGSPAGGWGFSLPTWPWGLLNFRPFAEERDQVERPPVTQAEQDVVPGPPTIEYLAITWEPAQCPPRPWPWAGGVGCVRTIGLSPTPDIWTRLCLFPLCLLLTGPRTPPSPQGPSTTSTPEIATSSHMGFCHNDSPPAFPLVH
jgi:hypothetical protein